MTTAAQQDQQTKKPSVVRSQEQLIYAVKNRETQKTHGISLYLNLAKHGAEVDEEGQAKETEEERKAFFERIDRLPDMAGDLFINGEKQEVVAWISKSQTEGKGPFITVQPAGLQNAKDQKTYFRAVNQHKNKPPLTDANAPCIIGTVKDPAGNELTAVGYTTADCTPYMEAMGFSAQRAADNDIRAAKAAEKKRA